MIGRYAFAVVIGTVVTLSLLFVAGAIAFLYALLPDLALTEGGLAVGALRRWRVVPWASVRTVR